MTHQQVDVTYSIEETVKVDGVDLPPGKYDGKRVRLGKPSYGGKVSWEAWEYKINPPGYGDLDCTAQVAEGRIKVL
jgi:hypothetical protein